MTDANGNHVQEWKYELYKNRNHLIAIANYDNHNVSIEYDSIKTITSFDVEDVDSIIWSLWWDDSKKEEIIDREFE